ncbi:hypothetical protein [Namhaeicola litoreus]|uniref:PEP-CTERM protein-sorting domain-containing protein n=1 Tax=Namhaeicola litoreus TaxID=1052145 RepID=A0ABW3XZI5_9FLAO
MEKKYLRSIVIVSLLFIVDSVFAQGPPPPPPPIDTPITGGFFVLMAAGIIYAIKSIKNRKN